MASTFTDLLRLERMTQGEQENTWGDITSDNLDKIEESIAGRRSLVLASSDLTLSTNNGGSGASEQAAAMILDCSGTITANIDIIAPNVSKLYIVSNQVVQSVAETVSIKTLAGAALEIPNGESLLVWCDGNDVFETINANITGTVSLATNSLQLGGVVAASYARLAIKNTWTNPQIVRGNVRTLTSNVYTPDCDTDSTVIIRQAEMTAALTINNPTGTKVEGAVLAIRVEQSASTPRSVTWGTQFMFTGNNNLDLTQTVDAVDQFVFQYDLGLDRWLAVGVAQNFPRS